MLYIICNKADIEMTEVLKKASIRSFSEVQVIDYAEIDIFPKAAVIVSPSDEWLKNHDFHGKYVFFGTANEEISKSFHIQEPPIDRFKQFEESDITKNYISYLYTSRTNEILKNWKLSKRYLKRYDFTDEWNNHGYGGITMPKGGAFDLASITGASKYSIASIYDENDKFLTEYVCFKDTADGALLWFNRSVGPVDSLEWSIIENFFANYRFLDLPCVPYIMELPAEYNGAMTMRLDCDQNIASARELFEMYRNENIPMSLAITTGNNIGSEDFKLIEDVQHNGGSILSHSQNHFPNWGGNYYGAYLEALGSKFWLNKNIGKIREGYFAVSPFHQNPRFAVMALKNAGYKGFVGGSIHNDPEYMLGRAGVVPFIDEMVSISQQCMLHGDCYHQYGNNIDPYKECFDEYYVGKGLFGYLDHPFSAEYQYGWVSEIERIRVHEELIHYIKQHDNVWYCNLHEAMNFILEKSRICVGIDEMDKVYIKKRGAFSYRIKVVYKNQHFVF